MAPETAESSWENRGGDRGPRLRALLKHAALVATTDKSDIPRRELTRF